jgi:hypothetical protein
MLYLNGRRFMERCQAKLKFFSSEKSFYLVMKCCEICKISNSVIKNHNKICQNKLFR